MTANRASLEALWQGLYVTFLLALVIVFLVLAAQFESFRHPLIIMMTVPLAVTGALDRVCSCKKDPSMYSARSAASCSSAWPPRTAS